MSTNRAWLMTIVIAAGLVPGGMALAQGSPASPQEVQAALKVIDLWRGRWQSTITTTRPQPSTVTTQTEGAWTLGERFLKVEGTRSDGKLDLSLMTYDANRHVYPLWIFISTGEYYYLGDGQWSEADRTMRWDSPFSLLGSYIYHCRFETDDTYRCRSVAKNALGGVLVELETVSTRVR